MDARRNFLKGVIDRDADERLLPEGAMRDALNIRTLSSESGEVGTIETCLGNEAYTKLDLGKNARTVGTGKSLVLNCIYWLVSSSSGCYFLEYNFKDRTATKILEDTRPVAQRVLKFSNTSAGIKIVIIDDSGNGKTYACWLEGDNGIRFVNIERAKSYGPNGFGEEEISLIKKPPLNEPSLFPISNPTSLSENNLSEKFLRFAYRYRYLDGEYSAFSPFTQVVFMPKPFEYNYQSNSNDSMVNRYNEVEIEIDTGSHLVTHIEILFKESNNNTVYRTSGYKKSDERWGDNETVRVVYNDKKIHSVVPDSQLKRLYDAVPRRAKALGYIGGQLMVGNYEEDYDLLDHNNNPVVIDLSLGSKISALNFGSAYKSVKSIRDYEVGLVYFDGYGRLTPVLTSSGNTLYIPVSNCNKRNTLVATIKHRAPKFAKGFRFFIKQSRTTYDTIVCTLFYEDQNYRWIRLLPGERDKVKEGDYLIVKAGTEGVSNSYIEARVIEVVDQPANFLDEHHDGDIDAQVSGTYFKIEEKGFRLSKDDFSHFYGFSKGHARYGPLNLTGSVSYFEQPIYYGTNAVSHIVAGGVYTNHSKDIRFVIEIDSVTGANDTFRWSEDNGRSWTIGVPITGLFQTLAYGITISFSRSSGNMMGDKWILSAKGKDGDGYGAPGEGFGAHTTDRAYAFLPGPVDSFIGDEFDEGIKAGASIQIYYGEHGRDNTTDKISVLSTKDYANIEEWWIGDFIEEKFNFTFNHYWFRRGHAVTVPAMADTTVFTVDPNGPMHLCVRSRGSKAGSKNAILVMKIEVSQNERLPLFETKSVEEDSDIFFEIGKSYKIDEFGNHLGSGLSDRSQSSVMDARIDLDWFNCFGWGNGFESYKIKDALNGKEMGIGARAHSTLDEYKKNSRKSSITWSGVFEQSTNYNALNEFNLSKTNYIDLDDAFGAIQLLHSRDTNLIAFQENRVQPLGYMKTQFFDQSGNPTMVKSDSVLSVLNAYAGEYGMSHPESFAVHGNRLYWLDSRRGTPLRLSQDGISELSRFGHKSFFKQMFRMFGEATFYGAFDPYFDEYVSCFRYPLDNKTEGVSELSHEEGTMGFNEDVKGWTSRYSYFPEGMIGLNNDFYSFHKGQLYKHNSDRVPRNNFYGKQYTSKVSVIFNDHPSDDKIFKALNFEGNRPWRAKLTTNLTESLIRKDEFEFRESRWFAFTRRNERDGDMTGLNIIGLGNVRQVERNKLKFAGSLNYISSGDKVYQVYRDSELYVGEVHSVMNNTIEFLEIENMPFLGVFCYVKKDARSQGGNMRGYFMQVDLETEETGKVELFSVGTKVSKSYV